MPAPLTLAMHLCATVVCYITVNLPGFYYTLVDDQPGAVGCGVDEYSPGLKKQRACGEFAAPQASGRHAGRAHACHERFHPFTTRHATSNDTNAHVRASALPYNCSPLPALPCPAQCPVPLGLAPTSRCNRHAPQPAVSALPCKAACWSTHTYRRQ